MAARGEQENAIGKIFEEYEAKDIRYTRPKGDGNDE